MVSRLIWDQELCRFDPCHLDYGLVVTKTYARGERV